MPKVLISDKMSPQAAEIFKQRGVEVDVKTGLTPDELAAIIGQYDGLAIRSATKVTAAIMDKATNLKVIGRAGIGVDNVDVPAASARGIVVMNTPFGNSVTTAEHAIAMMMALARDIPQASASTHAGKWEKNKFMGVEVTGKTLGLIGCGNIGSIVADRAQGLKMHVIAFDPFLTEERAKDLNVEKVDLDTLLAKADFISLHTPLTEGTKNILGPVNLAKTKKGVRIINCARGGLIDEAELKKLLDSGHIGGAALDVFAEEPATSHPLFGHEKLICTPHLGASTNEAQENVAFQVAEQIAEFLVKGTVVNALNLPSVSAEESRKLKPYMNLAEQLGSFAGQITETGIKSVTVEYDGAVSKLNTKPISAVLMKGLLSPFVEGVNLINAPVIAKERNIKISETKHERAGDYRTLISLTVESERQKRTVSGTLFGKLQPRIVEINGVKLEAGLGATMLFIQNEDKPGLIGGIGTVLGKHGVNIANFNLGRGGTGSERAIALVEIDQEASEAVLKELEALPSVLMVKQLRF